VGYFFLPAVCLAEMAACLLAALLLALDCFWLDFFWFAFGDLSPIMSCFLLRLICLRNESFSEGAATMPGEATVVNGGPRFTDCFSIWKTTRHG
jgi:hypothetical protein